MRDLNWPLIYLASEWIIRFAMLVYVPRRRSPAAARTWLLLVFILPWPGILVYAIFGRAYLPHRRLQLQARLSQVIRTSGSRYFESYAARPDLPPQFQRSIDLAHNLGDFPILGGNQVELLDDYGGSIDRLIADIAASTHHVHLLYYIFADDDTGRRVADALIAAAARGVQCRLLLDSMGSKAARRRLAPRSRAGGVEVQELLRFSLFRRDRARFDLRNHRKIAVLDGRIGYVGSQNIVNADFKRGIVYEDLVARVVGPVVMQLHAVFLADRFMETETRLNTQEFFPPLDAAGGVAAQVLPSGPGYPQANNQRLIVALVHAAQQRVVITTPYFIPDDALLQAMQTAVLRGVEVHLIASRQADQVLVALAQRSFYDDLLAAGVIVHLYRPRFLHAKHISIDGAVAMIGSSNIDIRSFQLNAEVMMLVYDASVVAALQSIDLERMAQSDVLDADTWSGRPFLAKMFQNTARLVDTLL